MVELVSAETEYAKDNHMQPTDISQLRDWLSKQPHLPQHITDEYLIATEHSSEYSVEQAKNLLEMNITCRTNYTEIFSNRDPLAKDKQAIWRFLNIWVSPNVTRENYRILYAGLRDPDPEIFDFPGLLSIVCSAIDTVIGEQGICPGYVFVLNCSGVTLGHLAKASISHIRNILHYVQDAICIKIKAIHVIYVSPVIDKIMFIVKPFLKKALLDMLFFHTGEMEKFYKVVPKDLLPPDIGGTDAQTMDELVNDIRSRLESRREWLIEMEKLMIDESQRPSDKRDTYSVAGSFRKLELD